jgi:signal transduction histidine kinase
MNLDIPLNDSEKLEFEKQKLKLILSLISDGVIIVDTEQHISYMNQAAEEITGFSIHEMLAHPIEDVLVLLDQENNNITATQYCPSGQIDLEGSFYKNPHLKLVDSGDKIKDIDFESRKMKGGSQSAIGCIIILKNVGEKRELEKMKIDFTSMAVHILRTPLTILRGYLADLSRSATLAKLDQHEIESLTSASLGANELNTLIEDLLHLTEIQQGNFKIYPSPFNYEGLVASVVLQYQSAAHAKGLSLVYNNPLYEFPMIRADIERIKELLANLISNAIKFTDKGFIEIRITYDQKDITTVVSDTGRGIAKEKLKVIFSKFYREKDNPLAMAEGYGIGLFICQKIIEAHKGRIWVESKEGLGSSFYFTLPVA